MTEDWIGYEEWESLAHLSEEEVERLEEEYYKGYVEGDEEEEGKEEEEGEVDEEDEEGDVDGVEEEGEEEEREGVGSEPSGDDYRPFILPKIWLMNNFFPKLIDKDSNKLWDCFQIPEHIPIRMAGKHEKCYSGRITDIGFYVSILIPLT